MLHDCTVLAASRRALGLPWCKTCEVFLCFVSIVRVYYADFFVLFVLRHWRGGVTGSYTEDELSLSGSMLTHGLHALSICPPKLPVLQLTCLPPHSSIFLELCFPNCSLLEQIRKCSLQTPIKTVDIS